LCALQKRAGTSGGYAHPPLKRTKTKKKKKPLQPEKTKTNNNKKRERESKLGEVYLHAPHSSRRTLTTCSHLTLTRLTLPFRVRKGTAAPGGRMGASRAGIVVASLITIYSPPFFILIVKMKKKKKEGGLEQRNNHGL
jgi:hypothetical protein